MASYTYVLLAQEPTPCSSVELYGSVKSLGLLSLQQSIRYGYFLSGRSFFKWVLAVLPGAIEPLAGIGGPSLKGQTVPDWVILQYAGVLVITVTLSPLTPFQALRMSTLWSAMVRPDRLV